MVRPSHRHARTVLLLALSLWVIPETAFAQVEGLCPLPTEYSFIIDGQKK